MPPQTRFIGMEQILPAVMGLQWVVREIGIRLPTGLVMLQAQLTKLGETVIMQCLMAQAVQ